MSCVDIDYFFGRFRMRNPCAGKDLSFVEFILGRAIFDVCAVIDAAECVCLSNGRTVKIPVGAAVKFSFLVILIIA